MTVSRTLLICASLAVSLIASLALAAPGLTATAQTLEYEQDCFDLDQGASSRQWDLKIAYNGYTSPHSVVFHHELSAGIAYPTETWENIDATLAPQLSYSATIVDRPLSGVAVVRTDAGGYFKVRLVVEDQSGPTSTIEYQSLDVGATSVTAVLQFEYEYLDLDAGHVFVENPQSSNGSLCPTGWDFIPSYNGFYPSQPTVLSPNDSQPIAIARPSGLASVGDVDDPMIATSTFVSPDYDTIGDPVLVRTTEGNYYALDATSTSPAFSFDWVRLDGIAAAVDGETDSTGVFVSQSSTFTNRFTDVQAGGTTYGHVVDRAGLWVTVDDDPTGGVRVSATGAPGTTARATVSACAVGSTTYSVSVGVGDVVTLTCGSIHADVLSGQAEIILAGGSTVAVPAGSAARVDQSPTTGSYSIEQTSGTEPVTLTTVSSTGESVTTLTTGAPPVIQDGDVNAPRVTAIVVESDRVEVGDDLDFAVTGVDDFGVASSEVSTDGGLTWAAVDDLDDHETAVFDAAAEVQLCVRISDFAGNTSQPSCVTVTVYDEQD